MRRALLCCGMAVALFGAVTANAQDTCLIISEVADGDLSGGLPKFVEITNTGSVAVDLSGYSVGNINNGANSSSYSPTDLFGTLNPGESYVCSYENGDGPSAGTFFDVFGFDPDNFDFGSWINGDDCVVLYEGNPGPNHSGTPAEGAIDVFGQIGVDGTGQAWEYMDSWARRNASVNTPTTAFSVSEWTFGGAGSLDGLDAAGHVAVLNPGTHAYDGSCGGAVDTGRCCVGTNCSVTTEALCLDAGGTFDGIGTDCSGEFPCGIPDPTGACCVDPTTEACQELSEAECAAIDGAVFHGVGSTCFPVNPCQLCDTVGDARDAFDETPVYLCNARVVSTIDLIQGDTVSIQIQEDAPDGMAITVVGDINDLVADMQANLLPGQMVEVWGTTNNYYGVDQIENVAQFVPGSLGTISPIEVTADQFFAQDARDLESKLVTLRCAQFVDGGGVFGHHQGYTVMTADGACRVYVSSDDLDIAGETIPTGPVDITGVVTQDYREFLPGYMLAIRQFSDIDDAPVDCADTGACCFSDGSCSVMTAADCEMNGGVWTAPGRTCEDTACTGGCCVCGICIEATEDECATMGGFLGMFNYCSNPWVESPCPATVMAGDIARGASNEDRFLTAEHIRPLDDGSSDECTLIGRWTNFPYLQSMEFDNYDGILHNAAGNLFAVNYGGPGASGAPDCPNDPDERAQGGKIYNLSTDGSGRAELVYEFNTSFGGVACTRIAGLGVSPQDPSTGHELLSVWGSDTGELYIVEVDPDGTGPAGAGDNVSVVQAFGTNVFGEPRTQGTAWIDHDTLIIPLIFDSERDAFDVVRVDIDAASGTATSSIEVMVNNARAGFTEAEYNPNISPYVYIATSDYVGTSYSELYIIDISGGPGAWTMVKKVDLSGCSETLREIALGPDGKLYLGGYGYAITTLTLDVNDDGVIDATDVGLMVDDSCEPYDCREFLEFGAYNGLDVAHGRTEEITGACCIGTDCVYLTEECCAAAMGTYYGDGSSCVPSPCLDCVPVTDAKMMADGTTVELCDLVVTNLIDLIGSESSKSFHAQDAMGHGVTIYGSNEDVDDVLSNPGFGPVSVGDVIAVQGVVTDFNGLFELSAYEGPLVLIDRVNGTPVAPIEVSVADLQDGSATAESLESAFVILPCVEFVETGSFAGGTNYTVTDDGGVTVATVRVAHDGLDLEGQAIPTGVVSLTGILGQYDNSGDGDKGYQFQIRQLADIDTDPDCGDELCPGDLNCDGVIDFGDINPFVAALGGQAAYESQYPGCVWMNADTNLDGIVNFDDINPFVALIGTACE